MTATAESILAQAMALPDEERIEFAERLWFSVPSCEEGEDDLTDEQKAMLDRRWQEIESGKVKCRPAEQVLDEIEARLHERLGTTP